MILVAAGLAWLVGIAKQSLGFSTFTITLAVATLALLASFFVGWRRLASIALLVAIPLSVILLHQPDQLITSLADSFASAPARFHALQDSSLRASNFGLETQVKIQLDAVQLKGAWHRVNATGQLSSKTKQRFSSGESFRGTLLFTPSNRNDFDFRASLDAPAKVLAEAPGWQQWVSGVKARYLLETRGVNVDAKALVTGLAIGNTAGLSEKTKTDMTTVSLTHLVAVSGANCAIVVAAVFFLLGRVVRRRWWRFAVTEAVLLAYVYVTEAPSSVVRAAVMASVVILARTLGRKVSGTNAIALAVLLIFSVWPAMATDFGFALSAAATFGLLVVAPELLTRLPSGWPLWLRASVAVSASAQLLCTPILLQFQAGLPLYSIPANLVAEPLVAPVTILGLLALLLVGPLPWLASALVYLSSLATNFIALMAGWFAKQPEATLPWLTGWFGMAAAASIVLAIVIWATTKRQKLRRNLSFALVAVAAFECAVAAVGAISFARWPTSDWFVVSCDVGQGDATLIRSQGQTALIDVGKDPALISQCLGRLGVKRLDLLVLTHFDMDHVGGLSGVLEKVAVNQALVTSFHDDRPGANFCRDQLNLWKVPTAEAAVGSYGTLGEFAWRVLSPHPGAPEAEDSNDGSITMLFESPRVDLLTLADLGEKGQMRLAREQATWMPSDFFAKPLVLKVSHHGSADQYPEFIEALQPDLALISVGAGNGYGHPTRIALQMLRLAGAEIARTDRFGSIAIGWDSDGNELERSASGPRLVGPAR